MISRLTFSIETAGYLRQVLLKGKEYPGKAENKSKQAQSSSPNMFRLASDASIARDPVTACKWQYFIS